MSIKIMSSVWDDSGQSGGTLLVLLAMADFANDDGICWPSVARLGEKARLGERQVQRALRKLEEDSEVEVIRVGGRTAEGGNRATVYRVLGQNVTLPRGRHPRHPGGDTGDAPGVTPMTPQPSVEPSVEPSSSLSARARANGNGQRRLDGSEDGTANPHKPEKVDGKVVTKQERAVAKLVLEEFNRQAGTAYRAPELIGKIVLRIREHPEIGPEGHTRIIKRNLANPWWKGRVSPPVIYGNAAIFESAMHVKDKATAMTTREHVAAMNARRVRD